MSPGDPPKLFISYSWTNADHEAFILKIANDLVDAGVHVILDKWDLKVGHDSYVFMESMINDSSIQKVAIFSDEKYVERANSRSGGVGAETQIITAELYGQQKQEKFALVVCGRDGGGKPWVPTYYGGKIFIDLSSSDVFTEGFEQLVRWVYDRPLHVRPAMGAPPAYLTEDIEVVLGTGQAARRAIEALNTGRPNAQGAFADYCQLVVANLERFRIVPSAGVIFDEVFTANIDSFLSSRNEILSVINTMMRNVQEPGPFAVSLRRLFEGMLAYTVPPEGVNSYRTTDWDNFKFIVHEMFLHVVALCIKNERIDLAALLLSDLYAVPANFSATTDSVQHYGALFSNVETFEHRNHRLQKRRTSMWADVLGLRVTGSLLTKAELAQADMVIYLRSLLHHVGWYPIAWMLLGEYHRTLEVFGRSQSLRYFETVLRPLLGNPTKSELVSLAQTKTNIRSMWVELNLNVLMSPENIGTRP